MKAQTSPVAPLHVKPECCRFVPSVHGTGKQAVCAASDVCPSGHGTHGVREECCPTYDTVQQVANATEVCAD